MTWNGLRGAAIEGRRAQRSLRRGADGGRTGTDKGVMELKCWRIALAWLLRRTDSRASQSRLAGATGVKIGRIFAKAVGYSASNRRASVADREPCVFCPPNGPQRHRGRARRSRQRMVMTRGISFNGRAQVERRTSHVERDFSGPGGSAALEGRAGASVSGAGAASWLVMPATRSEYWTAAAEPVRVRRLPGQRRWRLALGACPLVSNVARAASSAAPARPMSPLSHRRTAPRTRGGERAGATGSEDGVGGRVQCRPVVCCW